MGLSHDISSCGALQYPAYLFPLSRRSFDFNNINYSCSNALATTCFALFYARCLYGFRALLPSFILLGFFHVHFIPDDGHEDRNVETIPLMDLCEMQCSLECRQVAYKQ